MTLAVLLAGARAGDVEVLAGQLRAAGAREVLVAPVGDGAVLRMAAARGERLLVCGGDLVANDAVLWHLATDPSGRSVALTGPAGAAPHAAGVREARGRVAEVLPAGAGQHAFLGALLVVPADLPTLVAATGHDVDGLLGELHGSGVTLGAHRVRLLHAERVTDAAGLAAARAAVAAVDEDAARLRLAVKERDDFFTTFFVSPWSPLVTRAAARLGLTPTGVTAVSVALAGLAALGFWSATRPALIAGAVLLYLGFVLDCVDGQLARYTRRFSVAGGWLDTMADRLKEYVVYAGLAAGAERAGLGHTWPLAVAAIVLQTVRHMTDAWYGAMHDRAASRPAAAAGVRGIGGRLGAASERVQADTGSPIYWLKRIVVFPIGERWALIAVVTALVNGRAALIAVLVWGGLAFAYTLALRGLRAASMRVPVMAGPDAPDHRDDGPLVRLLRPGRRAGGSGLDWLVPAALRAVEYLAVVAVGVYRGVPYPLLYLLLVLLALHHYDLVARMEKNIPPRRAAVALGWDGRMIVLILAALLPAAAPALLAGLAGYVGLVLGIRAAAGFAASRPAPVPVPEGGRTR
ncbi:CDP-alcohol phosphatidyltransferase family protein [Rhizomonospora bruguierae]|uniref:CDP-alcohol phosphatidyltransferase family protein n=1 Tax=Rhizomonospora bruguierae TaxID=1581705 RepID=UPI001BCC3F79|nr:CDP-alcohol phosphatidyltransferase family protein [Micromonospora sp. NBRC 107566]